MKEIKRTFKNIPHPKMIQLVKRIKMKKYKFRTVSVNVEEVDSFIDYKDKRKIPTNQCKYNIELIYTVKENIDEGILIEGKALV